MWSRERRARRDRWRGQRSFPSRPGAGRARAELKSCDRNSSAVIRRWEKAKTARRSKNSAAKKTARRVGSFSWRAPITQQIEYAVHIAPGEGRAFVDIGIAQRQRRAEV